MEALLEAQQHYSAVTVVLGAWPCCLWLYGTVAPDGAAAPQNYSWLGEVDEALLIVTAVGSRASEGELLCCC